MNITTSIKSSTILLTSALLLAACGGSDNSDSATVETLTGVFIDAPVQGLGYQTPNHQGTTNEKGEFTYQTDETVSFFFNGIDLGSAPAQAKFPVTLLPNSPKLAQIFQTLDHNADPAKIDISGITLGAALKAQLENVINNKAGTPDLEAILTDAQLATLQTSNNITLVNQTLVDEVTAADHLSDNIDPITLTASDFSNKLFLDSDGGGIGSDMAVITTRESGTGEFVGKESFTWSINDNGTANITFTDRGTVATKLSESGNRNILHVAETTGNNEFIRELYEALPLSISDMNGKHFSMNMDGADSEQCTARTLSFNGSIITVNEQCPDGFYTTLLQASEHNQLDNVIIMEFPEDNGDTFEIHLALIDGDLTNGKYTSVEYENSEVEFVGLFNWTETDSPLAAQ